jgi:hypothetical protein
MNRNGTTTAYLRRDMCPWIDPAYLLKLRASNFSFGNDQFDQFSTFHIGASEKYHVIRLTRHVATNLFTVELINLRRFFYPVRIENLMLDELNECIASYTEVFPEESYD